MLTIVFSALLVFVADRISKVVVQRFLMPGEEIPLIKGIFHLTYVQNPGAAFGILPYRTGLFIAITTLVLFLILTYGRKLADGSTVLEIATGLELGGALGNLVDRISSGFVVDFLDFRVWPVFNLADSAIVIGVLLFGYELLCGPRFNKRRDSQGSR